MQAIDFVVIHVVYFKQILVSIIILICVVKMMFVFVELCVSNTHTHTRLTALCPGLHRWASTRKVKPIWILLKQETLSGSGISWAVCKSAPCSWQITTPAPHHSFFLQAGCPSCRPVLTVLALKAFKALLILNGFEFWLHFSWDTSCRLPTESPGRWIGGRPPDMVASCDLSGWPHLTNKQSRTWQRQSHQTYWLGGRKGTRPVKTWGVVGMGSPLV